MLVRRLALIVWGVFSLTACGGGGSSGAVPSAPASPGAGAPGATPTVVPSAPGIAHFTISDPYSGTQSSQRTPQYFSPDTAAVRITTNNTTVVLGLTPNSSNCKIAGSNISCAVDVPVANGPLTYSVQALDRSNAVLSQAAGSATIDGTTNVALALQGVWKTASVQFANEHPVMGSPSTIAVNVWAYDADGALIVGPEPYTSPIPLHNNDTSGATSLSQTSVTHPCQCVTLTYDGKSYVNALVVPVYADGTSGQGDTLIPALRVTEYPIPSGSVAATNAGHQRMIVNSDASITFMEQNKHLGRVTMAGAVTEITVPNYYFDIAKTTDGTLWGASNTNTIDRINSDGSVSTIAQLPAPLNNVSDGTLMAGSDGNLWATISTNVGQAAARVSPSGDVQSFVAIGPQQLGDMTLGSDGNIWYAASKNSAGEFVRLTPDGRFTEFALPSSDCCDKLGNVTLGPDGSIYSLLGDHLVERITPGGSVSHLPDGYIPPVDFYGQSKNNALGFGPDGALWVSGAVAVNAYCDPVVERITTSGSYAMLELPIPCDSFNGPIPAVTAFASGPDGNLWYTRDTYVGKIAIK